MVASTQCRTRSGGGEASDSRRTKSQVRAVNTACASSSSRAKPSTASMVRRAAAAGSHVSGPAALVLLDPGDPDADAAQHQPFVGRKIAHLIHAGHGRQAGSTRLKSGGQRDAEVGIVETGKRAAARSAAGRCCGNPRPGPSSRPRVSRVPSLRFSPASWSGAAPYPACRTQAPTVPRCRRPAGAGAGHR
jgi:hypothetical protein